MLKNYVQKLPHFQSPFCEYFVTYRLFGSIPADAMTTLKMYFGKLTQESHLTEVNYPMYFEEYDKILDNAQNGPFWLEQNIVAKEVYDSLIFLGEDKIDLSCFTIMSNHVHALFSISDCELDLFKIMQSHKSFTARKCNSILNRSGKFWELETYDYVVRNGKKENIVNYILQNPVKAGLVEKWEDWKWTYLNPKLRFL